MKKFLLPAMLIAVFFASPLLVSADEQDGTNTLDRSRMTIQRTEVKQYMMEGRETFQEMRVEMREGIRENREAAQVNREAFREEHKDDYKKVGTELSEEQKDELKALNEEFKSEMEGLREELKASETPEDKEAIHAEMQAAVEAHYTAVKEVVGTSEGGASIVDARKSIWEENETLRAENRETRSNFREERREYVKTYRVSFVKRLGNSLGNIPTEKLASIADRIDAFIQRIEDNSNISDTRKDKILDQLAALKELIEEKLEGDNLEDEVLEIVEELVN